MLVSVLLLMKHHDGLDDQHDDDRNVALDMVFNNKDNIKCMKII